MFSPVWRGSSAELKVCETDGVFEAFKFLCDSLSLDL